MYDEIRQDWASSCVTLGSLSLELLKWYINRLPTLTQLPMGDKERWKQSGTGEDRVSQLEPLNFLDFGDFNCRPCLSYIYFINILD